MNTENPTTPALRNSNTPLSDDQLTEFQTLLTDIKGCSAEFKNLPGAVRSLQDDNTQFRDDLTDLRRSLLSRSTLQADRKSVV